MFFSADVFDQWIRQQVGQPVSLTLTGYLRVLRDSVAQNRGDDFVNYLDLSHYVRQNKAIDLTPRRPQAALAPASTQVIAAIVFYVPNRMATSIRFIGDGGSGNG